MPEEYQAFITGEQPGYQARYKDAFMQQQQALTLLLNYKDLYPEGYEVAVATIHPPDVLPDAGDPTKSHQWITAAFACTADPQGVGKSDSPLEAMHALFSLQSAVAQQVDWPE